MSYEIDGYNMNLIEKQVRAILEQSEVMASEAGLDPLRPTVYLINRISRGYIHGNHMAPVYISNQECACLIGTLVAAVYSEGEINKRYEWYEKLQEAAGELEPGYVGGMTVCELAIMHIRPGDRPGKSNMLMAIFLEVLDFIKERGGGAQAFAELEGLNNE